MFIKASDLLAWLFGISPKIQVSHLPDRKIFQNAEYKFLSRMPHIMYIIMYIMTLIEKTAK